VVMLELRWRDNKACHIGIGTKLSLKEKFEDQYGHFDSSRTKLILDH